MGVTKTIIGAKKVSQEVDEEENQEVNQEDRLTVEELSEEELKKLVSEALKEGGNEAKFILKLDQWKRPGGSFTDYGKFKILFGDVQAFELDSTYNYPSTDLVTYAIIPITKVVVILFRYGDNYEGRLEEHETLYVFSYRQGWKSLDIS